MLGGARKEKQTLLSNPPASMIADLGIWQGNTRIQVRGIDERMADRTCEKHRRSDICQLPPLEMSARANPLHCTLRAERNSTVLRIINCLLYTLRKLSLAVVQSLVILLKEVGQEYTSSSMHLR